MKKNYHLLFVIIASLLVASLACTAGETRPTDTAAEVAEAEAATPTPTSTSEVGAAEEVDTATLEPTNTPETPEAAANTPEPVCVPDAAYVSDITVPDNTVFAAGTAFTKTWSLQNDGACEWKSGTLLVFVSGDTMSAPASVPAPVIAAGATTHISVNFVAPATPGTYRSNWQLQNPDGSRFGPTIYVQIIVPANLPDLVVSNLTISPASPTQGTAATVTATLRNNGAGPASNVTWSFKPCDGCSFVDASGSYNINAGEQVNATLNFTYTSCGAVTATARVDRGNAIEESNDSNNTRDLALTVNCPAPVTVTISKVASHSITLGAGGASNDTRLGIAGNGDPLRAAVEFNLSTAAGLKATSTINAATLNLSGASGDCYEFIGPLRVYRIVFAGATPVYPTDFNSAPLETLKTAGSSADIFSPFSILNSIRNFVASVGAGKYQIRLQLEHDDAGSAYACMMQWANPTITITYIP